MLIGQSNIISFKKLNRQGYVIHKFCRTMLSNEIDKLFHRCEDGAIIIERKNGQLISK